jgi:enoyl-CoA hydratase/carnithine racemase
MIEKLIRYDVEDDGIGIITIDRPEKRNAMTYAMVRTFVDTLAKAGEDDRVRVVIITGSGGAFCAGTDLAEVAIAPAATSGVLEDASGRGVFWPITSSCPKPVIGAIDGYAVGMGAEFTSQCDVRIATTRARFAWNFAHRGLVPDTGAGSWLLPRLIGPSRALRLLYSGAFLEAAEAKEIGYVALLVEPAQLMDAARTEARNYLMGSPFAQRRMKELVWRGLERDVSEHLEHHFAAIQACFESEDHKEGVASFLERRPAKFVGR